VTELVGYCASVLVALSLMMGNIWRLRLINLIGCLAFTLYGLLVKAYPVAAVNAFGALVDAYFMWQMRSRRDYFSLMAVSSDDKTFLPTFLSMYAGEIKTFFPSFTLENVKNPHCIFILRNLAPAGLFVYEDEGNGTARVHLDYVTSSYRDLSGAHFLFNHNCGAFLRAGLREFVFRDPPKTHLAYLTEIGFTPSVLDASVYVKPLACGCDYSAAKGSGEAR